MSYEQLLECFFKQSYKEPLARMGAPAAYEALLDRTLFQFVERQMHLKLLSQSVDDLKLLARFRCENRSQSYFFKFKKFKEKLLNRRSYLATDTLVRPLLCYELFKGHHLSPQAVPTIRSKLLSINSFNLILRKTLRAL